jgi:hypothetical protein
MSLIEKGLEAIGGGRRLVTLIGADKDKNLVEVEFDVVDTFKVMHSTQVTSHAIEKGEDVDLNRVSDHVINSPPIITVAGYLSDNLGISLANASITNTSVSAKEKLNRLLFWQKTGTLLTLEGYGQKKGKLGKAISFIKTGIAGLFSSKEDAYYFGVSSDKIVSLVLSNLSPSQSNDTGSDIKIDFNLNKIQIAYSKRDSRVVDSPKPPVKNNNVGKKEAEKVDPKAGKHQSDAVKLKKPPGK